MSDPILTGSGRCDPGFSRRLGVIVLIGLLCRGAVIVGAAQRPSFFDFPDTHRYLAVARHIAAGEGPIESESVRAGTDPLYPLVLSAGVLLQFDTDHALLAFGRVVNSLAGLVGVVLLGHIGRHLFGPRVGLVAALILAIDPITNFFNALVLTETVYTMFLLSACVVMVRGCERGSLTLWGACGLFLGLATQTRSTSLFLPILYVPIIWHLMSGSKASRLRAVVVMLVVYAATLSPTTIRNYRLFGHIHPTRTGSGPALLEALGPWADGAAGMNRIQYPPFPPGANEYERDRICRSAALEWARENPGRVVRLALAKLRRTWSITINAADYSSTIFSVIAWLSVAPTFTLAMAGAWLLRRRRRVLLALLCTPAIYFSIIHMVLVGSVRYRVPAMPFVFLLAAVAIDQLWIKTRASRTMGGGAVPKGSLAQNGRP